MKKTLIASLLIAGSVLLSTGAFAQSVNGPNKGPVTPDASGPIGATHGQVWYTAAVNSDGTVAGCLGCNRANTIHLGLGLYQVGFVGNITAAAGFSRWVQVDTLNIGSEVAFCTTADRSGLISGIFVDCNNAAGLVDASFFLFVAR